MYASRRKGLPFFCQQLPSRTSEQSQKHRRNIAETKQLDHRVLHTLEGYMMRVKQIGWIFVIAILMAISACGSTEISSRAASPIAVTTPADTPNGNTVDPARLLIGDTFVRTTSASAGYAFVCNAANPGAGGATTKGPWFNSDGKTWNSLTKQVVSGVVSWASQFTAMVTGSTRNASGNGLPSHTTGTFPVPSADAVYAFDRNPNRISAQTIAWGLPSNPAVSATPTCLNSGAIGVLLTGVRLFAPTDALNRDAVAWEGQDSCQGHPERTGQYHYHSISSCLSQGSETRDTTGQHSPLVGYAADGFGIYGNLGESGLALTNANLDECHGHTHSVVINGVSTIQYHYHKTLEFPYALGCYRGTPVGVN